MFLGGSPEWSSTGHGLCHGNVKLQRFLSCSRCEYFKKVDEVPARDIYGRMLEYPSCFKFSARLVDPDIFITFMLDSGVGLLETVYYDLVSQPVPDPSPDVNAQRNDKHSKFQEKKYKDLT